MTRMDGTTNRAPRHAVVRERAVHASTRGARIVGACGDRATASAGIEGRRDFRWLYPVL